MSEGAREGQRWLRLRWLRFRVSASRCCHWRASNGRLLLNRCSITAAPKTLVPAMKRMPTKRGVHLQNQTADAIPFSLAFDNAPGEEREDGRAVLLGSAAASAGLPSSSS